jgi:hypothetical protein
MWGALLGLQPSELALVRGFDIYARQHRAVVIGPATLRPGSWFLCKQQPGDDKPWFGKVRRILTHHATSGGEPQWLLEAQWFPAERWHPQLHVPVIKATPTRLSRGPMWPCSNVVPITCFAAPLLERGVPRHGEQIVLARTWDILAHMGYYR